MDKAIDLLTKELKDKSQGQISIELGVSKTTINLLIKNKYPKPENMYKKILEVYGNTFEIIGVDDGVYNLEDAARIFKEIE